MLGCFGLSQNRGSTRLAGSLWLPFQRKNKHIPLQQVPPPCLKGFHGEFPAAKKTTPPVPLNPHPTPSPPSPPRLTHPPHPHPRQEDHPSTRTPTPPPTPPPPMFLAPRLQKGEEELIVREGEGIFLEARAPQPAPEGIHQTGPLGRGGSSIRFLRIAPFVLLSTVGFVVGVQIVVVLFLLFAF